VERNLIPVKEDKLRPVLERLTGTRAGGLLSFHDDHIKEILVAKGSSTNHQYWSGGYHEHLLQCFTLAQDLYPILIQRSSGPQILEERGAITTPHPEKGWFDFTLENAIVVLYLHDIEKIFKYGLWPTRYSERLKKSKDAWYLGILPLKYGVWLDEKELNALQYIHGEGDEYRGDKRVMNRLAGFCHSIDVLSARVLFDIRFNHEFVPDVSAGGGTKG
jgi:hypothetical protein